MQAQHLVPSIPDPSRDRAPRLMLYAHDTYGLGHFRRNLAIAQHLARVIPNVNTVLVTGSPVAHTFAMPPRTDYVKLPSVVKTADEQYRARNLDLSPDHVVGLRAALIKNVALHFAPDVVLVDHAPLGMKGEALPALAALRDTMPHTRLVLGLRDVLDEPEKVRRQWGEQGTYGTIERLYDRILIYGQANLYDAAEAYAFPPALSARTRFTGYIQREESIHLAPALRRELDLDDGPFVLVTTGGGGDGAALEERSLEALTLLAAKGSALQAVVVTGPLMGEDDRARLEEQARPLGRSVRLIPFHHDLPGLMRAASLVIAMGGYNTACEIVSAGTRAIIVPRTHPRREQHIRAQAFAAHGLIETLPAGGLTPSRLAEAILAGVQEGPVALGTRARWDRNGLPRIAAEVAALLAQARAPQVWRGAAS